jgi:orotate phosphoribosyltransferase
VSSEQRSTAPGHATGAVEFVSLDDVAPDERFRLRPDGDVATLASSIGRVGQLVPVELRPLPGAVEGGPRWQVVAGFRRLAGLRLLLRERVLARLHAELPDPDAWALAIAHALLVEPLTVGELEALRERLAAEGVARWAGELIDEAIARAPLDPSLRERFFEFVKGPLAPVVERFGEEEAAPAPAAAAPLVEAAIEATAPAADAAAPPAEADAGEAPSATRAEDAEEVVEVDAEELLRGLTLRLHEANQELAAAAGSWTELPLDARRAVLVQARYVVELFPLLEEGPPRMSLTEDRDRLLELLRVLSFERRRVVLASGRESDFYVDCKRTTLTAEGHALVGRLLLDRVRRIQPLVRGVGGLTLGADPIASAIALTSHLEWERLRAEAQPQQTTEEAGSAGRRAEAQHTVDAFIVRKEPKGHGTGQWIEGRKTIPDGSRVIVIEDVVTTGGSALKAVERCREERLEVVACLALVDRLEGGREAIEAAGVPVDALYTRADVLP